MIVCASFCGLSVSKVPNIWLLQVLLLPAERSSRAPSPCWGAQVKTVVCDYEWPRSAGSQSAWFPLEDWKHKKKSAVVAILHLYSDTSWMGSNVAAQNSLEHILGDRQGYRHISCCPQHGVVEVTFPRCSLLSDTTTTSERGTVTALFGMVL